MSWKFTSVVQYSVTIIGAERGISKLGSNPILVRCIPSRKNFLKKGMNLFLLPSPNNELNRTEDWAR